MKNLLFLSLSLLLFSCSEKRITFDELSKTGGYWYYEGKKFTGVGFEMYNSEQVEHEIHYKDGEKDGEEKYYSKNGDLLILRTYKKDEYDGPYESYYDTYNKDTKLNSLSLETKGTYKNGELEGEIIECIDCNKDVSPSGENSFSVENLFVKGNYINGVRIGKFQYYTKTNPNFSVVIYDEKGTVTEGIEINSNNFWEPKFIDSRKIKK
jgi:antitoxin component YwqK of YwqJK toxin-antitoxin module